MKDVWLGVTPTAYVILERDRNGSRRKYSSLPRESQGDYKEIEMHHRHCNIFDLISVVLPSIDKH